jgi:hypothetical protein
VFWDEIKSGAISVIILYWQFVNQPFSQISAKASRACPVQQALTSTVEDSHIFWKIRHTNKFWNGYQGSLLGY